MTALDTAARKLSYRPEIDGLRAVAVIAVILYHAELLIGGRDWFLGGYLGVDVFFVISGYLITRIIYSELKTSGRFSFLKFYERRVRRILPALLLVMVLSIPFAWHILYPTAFMEYAQSILWSLGFGSNFFFYGTTTEYGADSALLKPFLHTWSLAVEEQFYVVFPIISLVAFKFFRQFFVIFLTVLVVASLAHAELMTRQNPTFNFYSPFSRFWELGVGSLLAVWELNSNERKDGRLAQSLSITGLVLILASVLYIFDANSPHPGLLTLVPVFGTALIIRFGSAGGLSGAVLGNPAARGIGLISYSAYLWHFPIFAFARLHLTYFSTIEKLGAIVLTFILSIVSYKIFEQPFRNKHAISTPFIVWGLPFAAISILASVFALAHLKASDLTKARDANFLPDAVFELDNQYLLSQRKNNFGRGWSYFQDNYNSPNTKLLVWGDSHGADFFQILQASKYSGKYSIRSCDLRLIYFAEDKSNEKYLAELANGSIQRTENCLSSQRLKDAEIVVISDSFEDYEIPYLAEFIQLLKSKDKKVVVLGRSLRWPVKPQFRTFLDEVFLNNGNSLYGIDFEEEGKRFYEDRRKAEEADIEKIRDIALSEGALFLDKREYQCDLTNQSCDLVTSDLRKIYSDFHHITLEGAQHFGAKISEMDWFDID